MPGSPDRADAAEVQAHALHSMILERCRRPLGHEMKNAVQSLYSGIEILARSVEAGGNGRISVADCVPLLRQQLNGLQRTLDRILEDVAPETAAPDAFDLRDLAQDLARFLATDAAAAGVKLQLQLPQAIPAVARAGVVRRVLLGLVLHAIDELRGGGRLEIAAREEADRVHLDLRHVRSGSAASSRPPDDGTGRRTLQPHYLREAARDLLAKEGGECSFDDTPVDGPAVRLTLLHR